jgi:X-X-X-Leu-X-X-Gly heptad repeat protein
MRRTAGSVRQMQARLPGESEVRALRNGATSLATGQAVMADAVEQLHGGAGRLASGLGEFRRSSEEALFVGAEFTVTDQHRVARPLWTRGVWDLLTTGVKA